MTDRVKELALKLSAVCADARKECSWEQLYYSVTLCLRDVLRSMDCEDCRKEALRHAMRSLPKELRKAAGEGAEKYLRRVSNC